MADYEGDICGCVTSQAVLAGEKDPTELGRGNLARGFKKVDLAATEAKVIIPGAKARDKAETQYGIKEVTG